MTNRFLHGPAVDQVFASEDALAQVLWGLPDNQGTVRDWVKYDEGTSTTSVVNHLKFDSFGNITAVEDGAGNPSTLDPQLSTLLYAYTGRVWDPDSELYSYRARWYDPEIGRFISEDPIGFAGGDANLNRYVGNSPTNATDPSGLRRVPLRSNRLNLLYLEEHPEIAAMMAVMNRYQGSWWERTFAGDWLDDTIVVTGWIGEAASFVPVAGDIRDVGEVLLGWDIHGNDLDWTDRGLTAAAAVIPIVAGSWIRRLRSAEAVVDGAGDVGRGLLRNADEAQIIARQADNVRSGGRLGSTTTRRHVAEVADELESRGWTITHGGGRFGEEWIPPLDGGRRGGAFPDITAEKAGHILRVNTIDTLTDGVTPTVRELRNGTRIRKLTSQHLLMIPKPK